jgi:hypothetical protein
LARPPAVSPAGDRELSVAEAYQEAMKSEGVKM